MFSSVQTEENMQLVNALFEQYHKAGMNHIAAQITAGNWSFQDLWEIVKTGETPLPQRAAWAMDHTLEQKPELLELVLEDAANELLQPHHDAVYRALLKGFERLDTIPEEYEGALFDRAIRWMLDPKAATAVRVFSISLAAKIAKDIPELREEVCLTIESQIDYASAGFRSRGGKVLKKFRGRAKRSVH